MATDAEHLQQARHNQEFFDALDVNRFPDWAATALFYKAVHLSQLLFRSKSHQRRNKTLKLQYPDVWKEYQPLYTFSRLARYWCLQVRPEDVPYVVRRLGRFERALQKHVTYT